MRDSTSPLPSALPPSSDFCRALAGFGEGAGPRVWFRCQLLCWIYLAVVAAHSASRWASLSSAGRGGSIIFVGSCKTLGFLLMDLMSILGLWLAHQLHARCQRTKHTKGLEAKASALIAFGLVLALVEGMYWSLWLHDLRHRRFSMRQTFTVLASVSVMLTRPGLICAFLPAMAARAEAQAVLEDFLADVRSGKIYGERLLIDYSEAEARIGQLSTGCSAALACLLSVMGLGALLHGLAVWFWTERISFAPSAAVNVNYALAVVYTLAFLGSYFSFTGLGALHGQLVATVTEHLRSCEPDEVGKLVQAFHYLSARPLRWSLQVGFGRLDLDELKGRYISAAFSGNLAAKLAVRLHGNPGTTRSSSTARSALVNPARNLQLALALGAQLPASRRTMALAGKMHYIGPYYPVPKLLSQPDVTACFLVGMWCVRTSCLVRKSGA
eukprot:CAMPEP_0171140274 /NCGR_PEP_ID=MMETSP0766_2-20121228/138397_1 /TAXON_ID=439317 /ORGANISM="Gambierdiscus australes, Strain CAWD 149" /LENGTH=440 /DNA_ID=CAMNT_0011603957 /DNA_START=17 /DNA_END=1339 /DNA_ORIENTATION=+